MNLANILLTKTTRTKLNILGPLREPIYWTFSLLSQTPLFIVPELFLFLFPITLGTSLIFYTIFWKYTSTYNPNNLYNHKADPKKDHLYFLFKSRPKYRSELAKIAAEIDSHPNKTHLFKKLNRACQIIEDATVTSNHLQWELYSLNQKLITLSNISQQSQSGKSLQEETLTSLQIQTQNAETKKKAASLKIQEGENLLHQTWLEAAETDPNNQLQETTIPQVENPSNHSNTASPISQ